MLAVQPPPFARNDLRNRYGNRSHYDGYHSHGLR